MDTENGSLNALEAAIFNCIVLKDKISNNFILIVSAPGLNAVGCKYFYFSIFGVNRIIRSIPICFGKIDGLI